MHTTTNTYDTLTKVYNLLNIDLFEGKLPDCLITLQRKSKAYGYFSPERFELKGENSTTHEIALNPSLFQTRTEREIFSTLCHEMIHLWQQIEGKPSRSGYHNKQWAERMEKAGLLPTDTGLEGGKKTGQSVTHIIVEGGKFEAVITDFLATNKPVLYQDIANGLKKKKSKNQNKVKYCCLDCDLTVWGKSGLAIKCFDCDVLLSEFVKSL